MGLEQTLKTVTDIHLTKRTHKDFGIITFGLLAEDARAFFAFVVAAEGLKALVHYCPVMEDGRYLIVTGEAESLAP